MLDAVLFAHAVERMLHGVVLGGGVFGEGHAIVGEHPADLVGERRHDGRMKAAPVAISAVA